MLRSLLFLFFLCPWINVTAQTWIQTQREFCPGGFQDLFGWSVSIDGNFAVVGVPDDENDSNQTTGAAYVYQKTNNQWELAGRLLPSDGKAYDNFGVSVDISGSTIVVGASGADPAGNSNAGMVYAFEMPLTGWQNMTETALLQTASPASHEAFGHSVAISGSTIVAGAIGKNSSTGSIYLYEKGINGWTSMTETAQLTASDGASGDYFGWSLDIDGDAVAVGSIYHDYQGSYNIGSAYVFEKLQTGWANAQETAKLVPSKPETARNMGNSITISNNTIGVGAILSSINGSGNEGVVLLYEKPENGWSNMHETHQLVSPLPESSSFGKSVALSPSRLLISAPHHSPDADTPSGGIVYVYSKENGSWDFEHPYVIYANDAVQGTALGYYVGISGSSIIASATGVVDYNWAVGSAYFFEDIINQPPVANNPGKIQVQEDAEPVKLNLHEIFSDEEDADESLSFRIAGANPDLLQVSLNRESLTIHFLPDSFGVASVIVEAIDSNGGRGRCTIEVEVKPVPDQLVVSSANTRYGEKGSLTISRNPAVGREVTHFVFRAVPDDIFYFANREKPEINKLYETGEESPVVLEIQPQKAGQVELNLVAAIIEGDQVLYGEPTRYLFSVQKATLEVTTLPVEKEYGEPMPEVTYSISGFVNGDTEDVLLRQPSLISEIPVSIPAGTYELLPGKALAENYEISLIPGILKVLKAPLAVLTKDMTIVQGSIIPEPMVSYRGFKLVDGIESVDVLPATTVNADENSLPGTYEIVTAGGADDNYYFSYFDGVLTIETVTGTKDALKDEIKIYPVPTSGRLWVAMGNNKGMEASLLSNTGKELMKISSQGEDVNFDFSEFPSGLYYLKITSGEGSVVRKIIKE